MQSSLDSYMCYVFRAEPSAGAMAKTIEAACKLRYQKVIDSNYRRIDPLVVGDCGDEENFNTGNSIKSKVYYNFEKKICASYLGI